MLLQEVKEHIKELELKDTDIKCSPELTTRLDIQKDDLTKIYKVMALTRTTEEFTNCLYGLEKKGSRYRDLVKLAEELFNGNRSIANFLQNNRPHLPFFINSSGTEMVTAVSSLHSANRFKKMGKTSKKDKDVFFDYYRTDTGISIGLGSAYGIDAITEIFKTALGAKDARTTIMAEHLGLAEIGKPTPTSMVAGNVGEALYHAIGQSPLLRLDDAYMQNSPCSVTKLFLGDGAMGESVVKSMSENLELEIYKLWRHYLNPDSETIEKARHDLSFRKKCYADLFNIAQAPIRLEVNVIDNGIAISRTSRSTHPMGDALSQIRHLVELGIATVHECNGSDLEQVLITENRKYDDLEKNGIVFTRYIVPRPAGHSASNFSGFGEVKVGKKQLTLNENEVAYHQNTDPLLNAAKTLINEKVIDKGTAISMIEDSQRDAIEKLAAVIDNFSKKSKNDLKQVIYWDERRSQDSWNILVTSDSLKKRKDYWGGSDKMIGYAELIGLRFKGVPDGKIVTPLQAENFSLADIIMLHDGRFRGIGQDICDIAPGRIHEVIDNPGLGLGGINRQTAKLQTFLHLLNPSTGRYHIIDNGIDEPGQYDIAAGLKRAFGDNAIIFLEIQFNDYDFFSMSLEQIATTFQRSNGFENLPVMISQSSGFFRANTVEKMWGIEEKKDGAGGMYHTSFNFDFNRFPGIMVAAPNTARAVQMAYRNAVASKTPTLILMTEPVRKCIPIKFNRDNQPYFEYRIIYYPLDHPLDPVGSVYAHPIKLNEKSLQLEDHNHIIFSFGEYVPLSSLIAGRLFENSPDREKIKTLVIDYNWINPRDMELPHKLFESYINSGKELPHITIISQQSKYGFGNRAPH